MLLELVILLCCRNCDCLGATHHEQPVFETECCQENPFTGAYTRSQQQHASTPSSSTTTSHVIFANLRQASSANHLPLCQSKGLIINHDFASFLALNSNLIRQKTSRSTRSHCSETKQSYFCGFPASTNQRWSPFVDLWCSFYSSSDWLANFSFSDWLAKNEHGSK